MGSLPGCRLLLLAEGEGHALRWVSLMGGAPADVTHPHTALQEPGGAGADTSLNTQRRCKSEDLKS